MTSREVSEKAGQDQGVFMSDLVYVGIVVAFFVVSALYVRFCETL